MRVCHLDTCPVGVATQNPELRKRFTGGRVRRELLARSSRRRSASTSPSSGFRSIEEAVGQTEVLDVDAGRSTTGRPHGPGPATDLPQAGAARGRGPAPHHGAGPRAGARRWTTPSSSSARARWTVGDTGAAGPAGAQRQPHGRHHARLRGDPALGCRWAARRHHRRHADRLGRAELRRVPAPRDHPAAGRRRQRLRRQGAVRRADHAAPGPGRAVRRPRRTSSPATCCSTARRPGSCSCAASSASGSACATRARWPSSRASATTAAST